MKKKLLVAALSLGLVACTEGQPKVSEPKKEAVVNTSIEKNKANSEEILRQFRTEIRKKMSQFYDFSTDEFLPEVTMEQKAQFIDLWIDRSSVQSIEELNRFDREEVQPRVSESIQLKKELEIQKILDKCVVLIGPESSDHLNPLLYVNQGFDPKIAYEIKWTKSVQEYIHKTEPNYLTGRVQKCITYLYGHPYSLKNFEYQSDSLLNQKKQQIELLYQQAYLEIKAVGLLRSVREAYYPKSLVRDHADQSGLTKYIQEQEHKAGKKLDHELLAIDFFKTREQWVKSLNQYINQKINHVE